MASVKGTHAWHGRSAKGASTKRRAREREKGDVTITIRLFLKFHKGV